MLEGNKVTKYFGGLCAVDDVDFTVKKGEILGLIGPNGAGKTTLFNLISGVYHPTSGTIKLNGTDISKLKPHKVCRMGIGRTHQIVRLFLNMTVLENATVSASHGGGLSLSDARGIALQSLKFVGLEEQKNSIVKSLILNDRKLVEIARALAINPQIVLLDEVAAGLNPTQLLEDMKLIRRIRDELGISVFWVEHVMKAVMGVAERIIVLHHGKKIAEGSPQEICDNQECIDAYLGEKLVLEGNANA